MKKTLVISCRPGSDFSLDLLWAGLVNKLGPENVIDYPPQDRHRRGAPTSTGNIEVDYGLERSSLCYTGKEDRLTTCSAREIFQLLREGRIERIFLDERSESFLRYGELRANLFSVPVVVVAGHDRFWNESPAYVKSLYGKNFEMMFVDDWQDQYDGFSWMKLINLSTNYDHLWESSRREEFLSEKVYDICFMGYNSSPDRKLFIDHLVSKWGHLKNHVVLETRSNQMDRFVSRREFFEKMARSKICINLRGASTCGRALRYYEIPYVGSYMLSQKFPARLLHPFVDGEHCGYFDDVRELDEKIDRALADECWRESIAAQGHRHAMEHHTVGSRITYIYESLESR